MECKACSSKKIGRQCEDCEKRVCIHTAKIWGPGGPTPEKPTDDRDWLCKKCRGNRLKKLNIKPHI